MKKYKKTRHFINRAYHEAGHAVACLLIGVVPDKFTIEYPKGIIRTTSSEEMQNEVARMLDGNWNENELGFGKHKNPFHDFVFEVEPETPMEKVDKIAMIYLSGEAATDINYHGASHSGETSHCNRQALDCIRIFIKTEQEAWERLCKLKLEVRDMLSRPGIWAGVEAIANELISKITLSWPEAKEIIRNAIQEQPNQPEHPEKQKGGNREEVPLERIVLSNMYSMEALIDVLVEKGLVTKEEVLKRIEKVVEERGNK